MSKSPDASAPEEVSTNGQSEETEISNNADEDESKEPKSTKNESYIPPHLLGRNIKNPEEDVTGSGRRVKPRLGVKVPYLNLTSQIVSQDEIAKEILERSMKKYTMSPLQDKGDIVFQMKLTHRLANKITSSPEGKSTDVEVIDGANVTEALLLDDPSPPEEPPIVLPKRGRPENSTPLTRYWRNPTTPAFQALASPVQPSTTTAAASSTADVPSIDDETLIAILEGRIDLEGGQSSAPSKKRIPRRPRPKVVVDPRTEKELALKQLMSIPSTDRGKKSGTTLGVPPKGTTISKAANKLSAAVRQYKIKGSPSPSTAPKRFPKKYHRIIRRQLRNSKRSRSPDQTKRLPEVPEVQIAIDRYIKTYANKRKSVKQTESTPQLVAIVTEKETCDENGNDMRKEEPSDRSSADESAEAEATDEPKANAKMMREINRLLGDEGAINMIYSVEQKRIPGKKREASVLPSVRRKKKDLLFRTKMVKNAMLKSSMLPVVSTPPRVRRVSATEQRPSRPVAQAKTTPPASRESSVDSESADETPAKVRKLAAEASRIIRRHSSSSDDDDLIGHSYTETSMAETLILSNGPVSDNEIVVRKSSAVSPAVSRKSSRVTPSSRKASKEERAVVRTTVEPTGESMAKQISLNEITVRRYDNLVQIILISMSTKMKNALNVQVLQELNSVLRELEKDDSCRAIVVTSTGRTFCQGVDLQALICSDTEEREKCVNDMIQALNGFIRQLAHFKKLLIAGVHGSAIGLGVTMLPFFDMVFASDKATFHTPYLRLGQIPEAGATLTLPSLLGNAVTSELLFGCRMLTASEALQFGLVTRILWPDKFNEELIPLAAGIACNSIQSIESTKLLLRQSMNLKLEAQLAVEAELLKKQWCSQECQDSFQEYLQQDPIVHNH